MHTLKGTAGTAGFAAFTEPAKQLQHLAEKERRGAEIPLVLLVLDDPGKSRGGHECARGGDNTRGDAARRAAARRLNEGRPGRLRTGE